MAAFSLFQLIFCLVSLYGFETVLSVGWDDAEIASLDIDTYDVIIIGAGMAGMGAGKTLTENGINNILVIEAQDYVGGRTKVTNFHNLSLNVGASWVGQVYNNSYSIPTDQPMFEEALKMNLKMFDYDWDSDITFSPFQSALYGTDNPFHANSTLSDFVTVVDTSEYWDEFDNITYCLEELGWNFVEISNYGKFAAYDLSMRAAYTFCGWYFKEPIKYPDINDETNINTDQETFDTIMRNTLEWFTADFESGVDPDVMSLVDNLQFYLDSYGWYPNDSWTEWYITDCRGYQGVTESIGSYFLTYSHVYESETNCTKIKFNDNKLKLSEHVTRIEYNEMGAYIWTNKSGNNPSYAARYVIITPSVGVLQSDLITFNPELPSWKRYAISEFSMNNYVAMYIKFPYNFWGDTLEDLDGTYNIMYPDWKRGYYTWALNLNDPYYLFNKSILRIDIVECQVDRISYQSKNEIMNDIYNKFQQYYSFEIPYPEDITFENWMLNPYTRGSWVNSDVQIYNKNWDWLYSPVKRLFFCGEHTNENSTGYVHSAYEAGVTCANNIKICMDTDDIGEYCPIYDFYWNYTTTLPVDSAININIGYNVVICIFSVVAVSTGFWL